MTEIDLKTMRIERRHRLIAEMERSGLDAVVLLYPMNQEYVGVSRPCAEPMRIHYEPVIVVLTRADEMHVWTSMPEAVAGQVPSATLHPELAIEMPSGVTALASALSDIVGKGARVGFDELTSSMLNDLSAFANQFEMVDASVATVPARLIKTPEEIECMRVCQGITETAMYEVEPLVRPGVRQNELTRVLLEKAYELGIEGTYVDPVWTVIPSSYVGPATMLGGPTFPLPHDDRFLFDGDLVVTDAGLVWNGYHSDFGKTWLCSHSPERSLSKELRRCHERWEQVIETAKKGMKPGRTCADVVRDVAAVESAYRMPHLFLGHGIGLDSNEMPLLGSDMGLEVEDTFELAAGMIIVLEPAIWEDGIGGFRSEEMFVITETGCEQITTYPCTPFE